MQPCADAIEADPQVLRLAVAGGQTESQVDASVPALQERGALQLFPGTLFRIAAHHDDRLFWRFDPSCALRRDFNLPIHRADGADHSFAVLQADVQRLLGFEVRDCRPVDRDFSGEFSLDYERLVVGFFDPAGEAISIFHRDLISAKKRTANEDEEEGDSYFGEAHSDSSIF